MGSDEFRPGIDDTQSFSVSEAVRAPVGARLDELQVTLVRDVARKFLVATAFFLAEVRLGSHDGFDIFPDTIGMVLVLWAARDIAALAGLVGPSRAARPAIVLAVLGLVLSVPSDLPKEVLGLSPMTQDALFAAWILVGLLGLAVFATVLARSHDAVGQFGRRGRWSWVRRVALSLAVASVPLSAANVLGWDGEAGAQEVSGLAAAVAAVVGIAAVVGLVGGFVLAVLLARALNGSLHVGRPVGAGER